MATPTEEIALALLARRPNADPLTYEQAGDFIIRMAADIQDERYTAAMQRIACHIRDYEAEELRLSIKGLRP
jgi:hypothetical protein